MRYTKPRKFTPEQEQEIIFVFLNSHDNRSHSIAERLNIERDDVDRVVNRYLKTIEDRVKAKANKKK